MKADVNENKQKTEGKSLTSTNFYLKSNKKKQKINYIFKEGFFKNLVKKMKSPEAVRFRTSASTRKMLPILVVKEDEMKLNDINFLKSKLMDNKCRLNQKKEEMNNLRIKYNKIIEENKNNKELIFHILKLENEKNINNKGKIEDEIYITKEQLDNKINCYVINKTHEKWLSDSYDLSNLRAKIRKKQKIISEKNKEYEKLKNNLTFRKMSQMIKNLRELTEEEDKYKRNMLKLNNNLSKNKKNVKILEKEIEEQGNIFGDLLKKEQENKEIYEKKLEDMNLLETEIEKIDNTTRKIYLKGLSDPNSRYNGIKGMNIEIKNNIKQLKNELKKIEEYKSTGRETLNNLLADIENKINEQNKKNKELNSKYIQLNDEYKKLNDKNKEYQIEKEKLIVKSKEEYNSIKFKEIQERLNDTKDKKDKAIDDYKKKEQSLQDKKNEKKEILEKIQILNQNQKNLGEKEIELNNKIENETNEINNLEIEIAEKNEEIEKLKKELEDENDEEKNIDKKLEELETINNELNSENEKYIKENEKVKKNIELLEQKIDDLNGGTNKDNTYGDNFSGNVCI